MSYEGDMCHVIDSGSGKRVTKSPFGRFELLIGLPTKSATQLPSSDDIRFKTGHDAKVKLGSLKIRW